MTGETGGALASKADLLLNVPSRDPQRIQEAHITVGHIACSLIEQLALLEYPRLYFIFTKATRAVANGITASSSTGVREGLFARYSAKWASFSSAPASNMRTSIFEVAKVPAGTVIFCGDPSSLALT